MEDVTPDAGEIQDESDVDGITEQLAALGEADPADVPRPAEQLADELAASLDRIGGAAVNPSTTPPAPTEDGSTRP